MPNFIQKNMGMITMVAAVISALILALPIVGVNLTTKEGAGELKCLMMVGGGNNVGFDESVCELFYSRLTTSEHYYCTSFGGAELTVNAGRFKGQSVFTNFRCTSSTGAGTTYFQR